MTSHILCRSDDVAEGVARGFIIGAGVDRLDVVLVRARGALLAYLNSCPHQGTPLETFSDKFLDESGSLLICSTHGARFRIGDGYCISGPCAGKSLTALDLVQTNGMVSIKLPA